jgi:hypothetical protein
MKAEGRRQKAGGNNYFLSSETENKVLFQPSASCLSTPASSYIQFLHIALGSLRELDTQLIISKEVGLASPELFTRVLEEVDRFQGILVSSIQKIKS